MTEKQNKERTKRNRTSPEIRGMQGKTIHLIARKNLKSGKRSILRLKYEIQRELLLKF